ncbi:hypothetical protein B0T13DRAFT_462948 [Neurospora crassa]|nr:hypothetical protein B0T13DRAFT_462948 [Neurospora crassa]
MCRMAFWIWHLPPRNARIAVAGLLWLRSSMREHHVPSHISHRRIRLVNKTTLANSGKIVSTLHPPNCKADIFRQRLALIKALRRSDLANIEVP